MKDDGCKDELLVWDVQGSMIGRHTQEQHGALFKLRHEADSDISLSLAIESASPFVDEHYFLLGNEGAGQQQTLPLAPGEISVPPFD